MATDTNKQKKIGYSYLYRDTILNDYLLIAYTYIFDFYFACV